MIKGSFGSLARSYFIFIFIIIAAIIIFGLLTGYPIHSAIKNLVLMMFQKISIMLKILCQKISSVIK